MAELAATCSGLPGDLLNFQYDPVACAAAADPSGPITTIESVRLMPRLEGSVLRFEEVPAGKAVSVVTDVDGEAFGRLWLTAIERADESILLRPEPTGLQWF